jgi:hypothetical protein
MLPTEHLTTSQETIPLEMPTKVRSESPRKRRSRPQCQTDSVNLARALVANIIPGAIGAILSYAWGN